MARVNLTLQSLQIRVGLPGRKYALEDLFYKYGVFMLLLVFDTHPIQTGVDIYISAHQHLYERMWPVYDAKVVTIIILLNNYC